LHLSDEEAKALIVVREASAIDNATYRELNKVDALAASGALRRLRDAGLLAQKGRGSATYYVPTERLGADGRGLPTKPAVLSANSQGLSTNLEALSDNPDDLPTNPTPEEETARRALLAELPGDLAARVGALGRRSIPDEAQAVIVAVCRLRAWRPEELALLLQRNARHVRTYLRPLTRDGRLMMTNPGEPNDPQQAYRTIDGNDSPATN
jgi:ATP-dependent DNA helicase RecG